MRNKKTNQFFSITYFYIPHAERITEAQPDVVMHYDNIGLSFGYTLYYPSVKTQRSLGEMDEPLISQSIAYPEGSM